MALKATIFKLNLNVSDITRHYYQSHALTIARHPSENDERMMMRVTAFALNACEQLSFTKGLSTNDEPDLWEKSLSDEIEHWIEVGRPSEDKIRKACARAKRVTVYLFGGNVAEQWWLANQEKLQRFGKLAVYIIDEPSSLALKELVSRKMEVQCTIDEGQAWLSIGDQNIEVCPKQLFPS
ncbi:MAG: hypothetical protein COA42_13470 [Alteromonadaceae bacterium]|nr:MAG: hypothetical protein COA42_13470 [Alteromonadaceae bacterium]